MEVLVLESEPAAANAAIDALTAAGHTVVRCHDPGAEGFPCRALDPGACPLGRGSVRVVLDVRGRTSPHPTALEDGVTCALRHHLPVVVAGKTAVNPFAPFAVTDAAGHDVVAACERAADSGQAQHEAVASRALDATLRNAGLDGGEVSVRRTDDGLVVTLRVPPEADTKTREVAAVRVVGAVRSFDRYANLIDVQVEVLR